MYSQRKFKIAAQFNKVKAFFVTVLIHIAIIGTIAYSNNQDVTEYLPDFVKEWFGWEAQDVAEEGDRP